MYVFFRKLYTFFKCLTLTTQTCQLLALLFYYLLSQLQSTWCAMSPRYAQYCMIIALSIKLKRTMRIADERSWLYTSEDTHLRRYSSNILTRRRTGHFVRQHGHFISAAQVLWQHRQIPLFTRKLLRITNEKICGSFRVDLYSRQKSSPWSVVRCLYSRKEFSVTILYDVHEKLKKLVEREIRFSENNCITKPDFYYI